MPTVNELLETIPQVGRVEWIGVSPRSRGEIRPLERAEVHANTGLAADHHARSGRSQRQVTLIQAEHLPVVAALLGRAETPPELVRRNVVVSGINLVGLKHARFQIGPVILEGTGPCAPCSRMEENLGPGGHHAMRGHGGICARVVQGGELAVGDDARYLGPASDAPADEDD